MRRSCSIKDAADSQVAGPKSTYLQILLPRHQIGRKHSCKDFKSSLHLEPLGCNGSDVVRGRGGAVQVEIETLSANCKSELLAALPCKGSALSAIDAVPRLRKPGHGFPRFQSSAGLRVRLPSQSCEHAAGRQQSQLRHSPQERRRFESARLAAERGMPVAASMDTSSRAPVEASSIVICTQASQGRGTRAGPVSKIVARHREILLMESHSRGTHPSLTECRFAVFPPVAKSRTADRS